MREFIEKVKHYYNRLMLWAKSNPKIVYYIFITILSIGFIIMVIRAIFEEKKVLAQNIVIPSLMIDSDIKIRKENEKTLKEIVEELDKLKKKEILTSNDSIRVRFLIDKYNILKDE